MNEYLSGKCAHCGRKKEEHGESIFCRDEDGCIDYLEGTTFKDSGEKLLHDRAPELLQAARGVCKVPAVVCVEADGPKVKVPIEVWNKLYLVIGDILKKEQ